MTSFQVVYAGPPEQRQKISATPIVLFSHVLEDACRKFKPALDPALFRLMFSKKPVDLSLSVRLANIPSGSRLDVVQKDNTDPKMVPAPAAKELQPTGHASTGQQAMVFEQAPPASTLGTDPMTSTLGTNASTSTLKIHPISQTLGTNPISQNLGTNPNDFTLGNNPPISISETTPTLGTTPMTSTTFATPAISTLGINPSPSPTEFTASSIPPGFQPSSAMSEQTPPNAPLLAPEAIAANSPILRLTSQVPSGEFPVDSRAATADVMAASGQVLPEHRSAQKEAMPVQPDLDPATHQLPPSLLEALAGQAIATSDQVPIEHSSAEAEPMQLDSDLDPASCQVREAEVDEGRAAVLESLGIHTPIHVFTRAALESAAAASTRPINDESDEFFELTQEDFAALMRAKLKVEAGFKTRAAREAEHAARMAGYGPIAIRLELPDGSMIQSQFHATDTVASVQDLVSRCLESTSSSGKSKVPPFYLFTAPPRCVLKDPTVTLYDAGLVPAALVHVAVEGQHSGPFLRPELLTLMSQQPPPLAPNMGGAGPCDESVEIEPRPVRTPSAAPGAPSGSGTGDVVREAPRVTASGQRVPKWLKVGK